MNPKQISLTGLLCLLLGASAAQAGNVHPLLARSTEAVEADPGLMIEHMVLHLQATPQQEAELEQLIAGQSDPASPDFRRYLTPQEFAERFGVGAEEIARITTWLESHGLQVEDVAAGNRSLTFRGTAAQVARAFQTQIGRYTVNGVRHLANATDPRIPAELANSVGGVVRLHDFPYQSFSRVRPARALTHGINPDFAPAGMRILSPGDYYGIYNINPLLSAGIDGTGQSIAVLARSNIYLSDVQSFRSMFGLKANDPQIIITNTDPGIHAGDVVEATLDTEWAGATAPGATVKMILSSAGALGDGIDMAASYAVNQNVAPIITVSYGACESQMGATQLAFFNSLWKQAAAQGQTVLVASGDSGVAGCDSSGARTATSGAGVNGICSSPYATCVGGTEFVEGSNPGQYWLPGGPGSTAGAAIGYIPESVWNESGTVTGGGGLAASGGGASATYAKPAWQTGIGVPADGKRDVPDVSLTAAAHDGYTVVQGGMLGYIFAVSGTSASTPSFAGMVALVNQLNKSAQGNINPTLYSLAAKQAAGGASIFHDVKTGDNSVPGLKGYAATAGYDLATGLGSVDANLMATLWNYSSDKAAPLSVYANSSVLGIGQTGITTVVTAAKGLNAAVALSVTGLPAGVTASFTPATIAAPGTGSSVLKLAAGASAAAGTYTVKLNAKAGAQTATSSFELTITTPVFALSYGGGLYPSVNFGPTAPFTAQQIKLQTFASNGFNSPITLSASGMPTGMTVTFSPATIPAGAVGASVATVSAANTIKGGNYSFTITATGGGVTQSVKYLANVILQPSCAVTPSALSTSFKAGAGTTITIACVSATPNQTPVSLSVSGAPGGVTAKFSSPTVTAGQAVTLTLTSTNAVNPGTYPLTLTGSEASGSSQTAWIFAAISTPVFQLALTPPALTATVGSTAQVVAAVVPDAGFTNKVDIWIGGAPAGVTTAMSAAPAGTVGKTIALTIDKTAVPGTYSLNLGGSENTGFSRTLVLTLTITAAPSLALAASSTTSTLKIGASSQLTLTSRPGGSFNAAVALTASGLPSGVTATFSNASVAAPGNGTVTMTLKASATARPGSYQITVAGSGAGVTGSAPISLTITR